MQWALEEVLCEICQNRRGETHEYSRLLYFVDVCKEYDELSSTKMGMARISLLKKATKLHSLTKVIKTTAKVLAENITAI